MCPSTVSPRAPRRSTSWRIGRPDRELGGLLLNLRARRARLRAGEGHERALVGGARDRLLGRASRCQKRTVFGTVVVP